jgi:hypothetical protein
MGRRTASGATPGNTNGLTRRVAGSSDPPQMSNDITLDKVVRMVLPLPDAGTPINITPTTISSHLFGGPSNAIRFRVKKASFWGNANTLGTGSTPTTAQAGRLRVLMAGSDSDRALFVDDGTSGSKRPNIHIMPGFFEGLNWHSGTNTDPIFTVDPDSTTAGFGQQVVVHVSLQIRMQSPED